MILSGLGRKQLATEGRGCPEEAYHHRFRFDLVSSS